MTEIVHTPSVSPSADHGKSLSPSVTRKVLRVSPVSDVSVMLSPASVPLSVTRWCSEKPVPVMSVIVSERMTGLVVSMNTVPTSASGLSFPSVSHAAARTA